MSLNIVSSTEKNGNVEDKYGVTHVCHAIKKGDKDLILVYIQQGLDMNYRNSVDGVTAFIRACNTGNVDIVKFLLDHVNNLNINITDKCGHSALDYSCQYGHNEILRLLLQRSELQVKLYSIQKGLTNIDVNILKELIDRYKIQGNSLLNLLIFLAKESASLDLFQYVLGDKTNSIVLADDIFLSACQGQNNIDTVDWLLNEGGEFKSKINTCTDVKGMTGLMHAAYSQSYSIVKLLLENGADPHVKDHNNSDAIYWAEMSYDDGADYMRVRDPPDIVVDIIQILREYEPH
ncbi:unnamed protein product [Rotaria sp. Silwood2]|nr:unnamed protein product [Rotaria sp. Silwood2]CAF3121122.1 unnamed protein product [Rotaria sp. Silwood2]CAF4051442.1 unnamed protein product [Rotaria sp. Silwood2]